MLAPILTLALLVFVAAVSWGAILGYLDNRYHWGPGTLAFVLVLAALSTVGGIMFFLRHFTSQLL